jgi:threonine dehydrogenase-like Zn-dependent dehydrogenase
MKETEIITIWKEKKSEIMKAIAITPGKGNADLIDIDEPQIKSDHEVKIEVLEVGICGTDREESSGGRADAPAGEDRLIIGHEMLGRVFETGSAVTRVKKDDLALFMVRRPCGHCYFCNNKRSDLCSSGDYKERGIKGIHGYQAEYVVDKEEFVIPVPQFIRDIGVLTEPMSVVVKAIEETLSIQTGRFPGIDSKKWLKGKKVLIAGMGPIGLLAAFILKLRGAEIYGLDIVDESSARPTVLKELGGKYINGSKISTDKIDDYHGKMDFVFEATGIAKLEFQLMDVVGINGVYVLTGIPSSERPVCILGGELMQRMVLLNQIMLGSVNASVNHYIQAVDELANIKKAFPQAINKIITEKTLYTRFNEVLSMHSSEEIKTVVVWKD